MKHRVAALAALVAFSAAAASAAAQSVPISGSIQGCGGDKFFSCLLVQYSTSLASPNTVTFTFTNQSNLTPALNPTSVFKLIGVGTETMPTSMAYTAPTGATYSFSTVCSPGAPHTVAVTTTGCSDKSNSYGNTFPASMGMTDTYFFGLSADPSAPHTGLTPTDNGVSFSLTFANGVPSDFFVTNQYGAFDLGGSDRTCSNKLVIWTDQNGNVVTNRPAGYNCGAQPLTATPEPSSLALLGTGLFGLVPMIRRRRK